MHELRPPDLHAAPSGRAGWQPFAAAAALYTALAVIQTFPLILNLSSVVLHDPGDPLMSTAILWWNAHVLPFTERWWDGFAFYPSHGSIAFSDPRVGEGLIATPLQWIGLGPAAAYNLTLLATYPLSALAAHWLAFVLTRRHDAGLIAGIAYGFCPYRGAHLAHLELLAGYGMPAALAALHEFLRTRRRMWLAVFSAALVVQGLSSSYYLLFFSVLLAPWLLWFVRRDLGAIGQIVLSAGAAAIVLLPQIVGFARIHALHGFRRGFNEIVAFSADAASLIAADPGLLLWGWTSRFGVREGFIFPGLVLPALVAACLIVAWRQPADRSDHGGTPDGRSAHDRLTVMGRWLALVALVPLLVAIAGWTMGPWRFEIPGLKLSSDASHKAMSIAVVAFILAAAASRPMRQAFARRSAFAFYALAAVLLFLCSFGPRAMAAGHEFLYRPPYTWLMPLPVFESIRVPARFAMPAMLALATAGAIGFDRLRPKAGTRRRGAIALALAAGIAADGWLGAVPLAPLPETWPALRAQRFAAVLELPLGDLFGDLAVMYRATLHGLPVVNGSSGFQPGYYAALRSAVGERDPAAFDWLSVPGPLLVVVDRKAPDAAEWDRFISSNPRVRPLPSDARWGYYTLSAEGDSPPADMKHRASAAASGSCAGGQPTPIASASDAKASIDLPMLTDGNPTTWWATPQPQREGDFVTVDFGTTASPCSIALSLGEFHTAYPRSLVVESSIDGQAWSPVAHVRTAALAIRAALADPIHTTFSVPLLARPGRYLRLRLDQSAPDFPWHITDLSVNSH
jgi:hypothetical protein